MLNEVLLEQYLTAHATPEHDYLYRLYRATQTHLLRPRMASGHLQGLLLKFMVEMIQPQTVLEIGTYSGYSALSMAAGMQAGSKIVTFEINDEQEDFTRPWLENAPFPPQIELVIGDVMELLPQREETYDMVFMDANKRDYCAYYDLVFPRLRKGGWLLADNTLWDGHVIEEAYARDSQTAAIKQFNDKVAEDDRVEQMILPIRDGLSLIHKIKK